MSGGNQMLLDQIKEAIENGTLTQEEIERRLKAAIETEFVQQDHPADSEFLNLCLDLLGQIQTGGHYEYVSHMEESKAAVTEKYQRYMRAKRIRGVATRVATVAAIVILLVGVVFQKSWFSEYSTPDEQQYVIQGNTVSNGTVVSADNDLESESEVYTTSSYIDAVTHAGFELYLPTEHHFSYSDIEYTIVQSTISTRFIVKYYDLNKCVLHYELRRYTTMNSDFAKSDFEQHQHGQSIEVNGRKVYQTQNNNRSKLFWFTDETVYFIESTLPIENIYDYMNDILKE